MDNLKKYLVNGRWSIHKSDEIRREYKERQQPFIRKPVKIVSQAATENLLKAIFRI